MNLEECKFDSESGLMLHAYASKNFFAWKHNSSVLLENCHETENIANVRMNTNSEFFLFLSMDFKVMYYNRWTVLRLHILCLEEKPEIQLNDISSNLNHSLC